MQEQILLIRQEQKEFRKFMERVETAYEILTPEKAQGLINRFVDLEKKVMHIEEIEDKVDAHIAKVETTIFAPDGLLLKVDRAAQSIKRFNYWGATMVGMLSLIFVAIITFGLKLLENKIETPHPVIQPYQQPYQQPVPTYSNPNAEAILPNGGKENNKP